MATKISGAENDIQATLYSMLGLSDVLAQQKELEQAEIEMGLYVDLATRMEIQASKGKRDDLANAIGVLRRTDPAAYNRVMAANYVPPKGDSRDWTKNTYEPAYWPTPQQRAVDAALNKPPTDGTDIARRSRR